MADIENKPKTKGNPAWCKGKSANPGGRPKIPFDFKQAVQATTTDCVKRLQYWAGSNNPAASVAASKILLAYSYGNPPDFVTVTQPNQTITVRFANDDQPASSTPNAA